MGFPTGVKIMPLGLLGKKLGVTQVFDPDGNVVPVTLVEAGPCYVTQVKSEAKDRYTAVQLGYEYAKEKHVTKPIKGHLQKANVSLLKMLREFRMAPEEIEQFQPGQTVTVNTFSPGDYVDITGTSKGKGFTGVMKRHNFKGFRASHGTHECFRHGGSIGCCTPQRVVKGTKMAGRHGNSRVTVKNLLVVDVQEDKNLLMVRGAVPGGKRGYLSIMKSKKKTKESLPS